MSDDANLSNENNEDGGNIDTGVEKPAWTAQLGKDLQTDERLTRFQNISELGKAYIETEGKLKTAVPGKDATEEEKAKFFAQFRPETPDEYKITKPADLPDELYDADVENEFKKFAHNINLTKTQAESLYGWYYGLAKNGAEIQKQEIEKTQTEAVNALKDEWKDKFDGNAKIATLAFKKYGKDASLLDEKIGNVRLGDHPKFLKVFHEIGLSTMDDKSLKGGGGGESPAGDEDAQAAQVVYPSMYKE